ncbi:MAG: aminotransferase class I/II-fold pyridoxal phosphate-dependent enzyme [Bacteroidota bacterium]
MNERIYLSPPNVHETDLAAVNEAMKSGWIAPVGPQIDLLETRLADFFDDKRVLLLNSGTSALHLSLILANVQEGDTVLTSTLTFAACANVILYQKAIPVFVDCEQDSWNVDPDLLEVYLRSSPDLPKAIIVTHLYGVPAKIAEIKAIAESYDIPLIEDAAEAMGSLYFEKQVGQFGDFGVLSFNGNKILTTGGGGALICSKNHHQKALHLATQANAGQYEYHHDEVGYNYRLSNVLAGLGLSQLDRLAHFIIRKKEIFQLYQEHLSDYFDFKAHIPSGCNPNFWLSVGLLKLESYQVLTLIEFMESQNIELRRFWKPLHLSPAYINSKMIKGQVNDFATSFFERGICLPSGTGLTVPQQMKVIQKIRYFFEQHASES